MGIIDTVATCMALRPRRDECCRAVPHGAAQPKAAKARGEGRLQPALVGREQPRETLEAPPDCPIKGGERVAVVGKRRHPHEMYNFAERGALPQQKHGDLRIRQVADGIERGRHLRDPR